MNLASTIKAMAEKKDAPPFDVSKADYAGAAKELTQYAKTKGGMDKNDFLAFANRMSAIANKKAPRVTAKFARDLMDLDTSPREKIVSVMRDNGIKVTVQGGGFKIEDYTIEDLEQLEELDEAMVRGKEVFDKTFANKTQADNFAKKNGGRVKQVGRVFYVFKEEVIAEDGHTDVASAKRQCKTIVEDAQAIMSALDSMDDEGSLPTWWTNKLAVASNSMNKMNDYISNPNDDKEEMDEARRDPSKSGGSGYDLYHKDFSSAMKHAYDYAKSKLGIEVDPKEIDDKVASGPRKPSKGKTNTYRLKGKDGKKAVQIQVANLDDKKFELNMYKESVDLEEAREDIPRQVARLILGMGVRQSAPESEILKRIPFALKKLGLQNDKLIQRDPDFQGEVIDDFRSMKEEVELDELKKYDKNKDYQLLNRLSQKAKTGKLTSAEKTQMANAKSRLRNHGFSEEVELDEAMRVLATKGKTKVVTKGDGVARVMVGNKEVASGDLDDGAGGWFMSKKGEKGQKFFDSPKKIADFYAEEVELDEAYKTPAEAQAYEDGKKAARAGKKYDDNPNKKGSKEYTAWSKGHNEARAKGMKEEVNLDELFESAFEEEKLSLEDTLKAIWEGKKLDPVNKKAVKKDFDDRKDKDLDNDGDVDDSDEYLHKRRKAVSKSMEKDSDKAEADQEKEVSKKEDEPKKKVGKSEKQTKVDVNPSIEEEKGEEMTSAEMEKKDEIMKSLEKKKDEFVKKYGDRAKEVMARTAIKMAKKHA